MAGRFQYHKVIKYLVAATCTEPLHIGSSTGEKESVLVHPVDNVPFLQASGIAGVFRSYFEKCNGVEAADALFGSMKGTEDAAEQQSKVRFSDGILQNAVLERRPRVSINRTTGTCDASVIQGTDRTAGHRFNMEYVAAGAKVSFCVYLYDEEKKEALEEVFAALHSGILQMGGQKSNGCGYLAIGALYCRSFDLTRAEDRAAWAEEEALKESSYENLTESICKQQVTAERYEITVTGQTEGTLLVKSIAVEGSGSDAPDSENIRNAEKNYIVPGSSFKGAVRSQMERIASYLGCEAKIKEAFGVKGKKNERGSVGCLYFYDTVVGDREQNDLVEPSHRIHIDKFTGGVMNGGLFSERNVFGEVSFRVAVKESGHRDGICGILLMALRDLAIGTMSVGSGFNIGKGIIQVSRITVKDLAAQTEAVLDFTTGTVTDVAGIVSKCMAAASKAEE